MLAPGIHNNFGHVEGHYDRALGVIGDIEVVAAMAQQHERLHGLIEVVVVADQKNRMAGCKSMAGLVLVDPCSYSTAFDQPINLFGRYQRKLGAAAERGPRSSGDVLFHRASCGSGWVQDAVVR